MKLEREERDRILAGDYAALKRDEDPGDVEGERIPILRQRARKQATFKPPRFSGEAPRFHSVQPVPEYWSLWIELGEPKRHRKGHWQISFEVHDERQPGRTLKAGGPPGPPQEPGLRTRERFSKENPRPKGEGVGKHTDESARGYGGGGRQALDHGGVDDDELKRQRTKADERWAMHREQTASDDEERKQMRRVRQQIREASNSLPPSARQYFLAGVERAVREQLEQMKEAA